MSVLKEPKPAKLIIALLYSQREKSNQAKNRLIELFGPIDWESPEFEFSHTHYYNKEMGEGLFKSFLGFQNQIKREYLCEIKLAADRLEREMSQDGKRQVNIDPGYLTLDSLVLSTGKDSAHRIYFGKGVYEEVQLMYHSGSFQPQPWSYPDYRSAPVLELFNQLRKQLKMQTNLEESRKLD